MRGASSSARVARTPEGRPLRPAWFSLAFVTLAALATLVGCDGHAARVRRRDPGALVVAQAAGAQSLDPVRVTDSESIEVGTLVFEDCELADRCVSVARRDFPELPEAVKPAASDKPDVMKM